MAVFEMDWPDALNISGLQRAALIGRRAAKPKPKILSFAGREEMSRVFRFELDIDLGAAVESAEPLAANLLGKPFGFRVRQPQDKAQPFHGIVRQVRHARGASTLHLDIVPWLWKLTLGSECRIFHELTAIQVVESVFKRFGARENVDFEMVKADASKYPKLEVCTQYRETAFNFVSRLLENAGIYYYFRFEKDRHVMVLGDATDKYDAYAGAAVPLFASATGMERTHAIAVFQYEERVVAERYHLTSYDSASPKTVLEASCEAPGRVDDGCGYSDFAPDFTNETRGKEVAGVRMQEEACDRVRYTGRGDVVGFHAGQRFELAGTAGGGEYLLIALTHSAREGRERGDEGGYVNSFACIPAQTLFRPTRVAPRPVIDGVQVATIVARDGQKDVDAEDPDRVFVHFPWDRGEPDPAHPETPRKPGWCPARAGGVWAGKGFGLAAPLRAGMEVAVAFTEGDPDRPIVVTAMYNGDNRPPYDPTAHPSVLALRTASIPGGSAGDFSEVAIDDTKDKERLAVRAKRNVELVVGGDWIEEVAGDRHSTLTGSLKEDIGELVTKARQRVSVEAGQAMVLKASTLTLRVDGENYITIGPDGVTITGKVVKLNCIGGAPGDTAAPEPKTPPRPKARPAEVQGGAGRGA